MTGKCLFIAPLFIFGSCSFVQKTIYFDSGENSDWERKTTTTPLTIFHTEKLVLHDSAHNEIGSISLESNAFKILFLGPPLIPAIPLFECPAPNFTRDLQIRGELRVSNIQQLNALLNDTAGIAIINNNIKVPVKITPYYNHYSGLNQAFEPVRPIVITCNYPVKKIKSLRIIPSNYLLNRAFGETKFIRKRKIRYNPFYCQMN